MKLSIFWFRRDLRIEDNMALSHALKNEEMVLPLFIFDENILQELPANDPRVCFIYDSLQTIQNKLSIYGSSLMICKGDPTKVWEELLSKFEITRVYLNKDYEPYAIERDRKVKELLNKHDISLHSFKDQVIFEEDEILKGNGKPYTVFTPYKNKWLQQFKQENLQQAAVINSNNFYRFTQQFPERSEIGFERSAITVRDYNLTHLDEYASVRDIPAEDATSYLSPHLRFGTISIRKLIAQLKSSDEIFLSELIWREFFMQILYNFPKVVTENFNPKYNNIEWRNNEEEFAGWCQGKTGYPLVDAGMRQLNATGYMHNRVRMVAAGFLCKHLLIDWRWGEGYFARKLLDYELSSNNGNWQWAAGTGCDAAPYFRIFNPSEQLKKFDRDLKYIKKWIPEYGTNDYPNPIVDHKIARLRALEIYKRSLDRF